MDELINSLPEDLKPLASAAGQLDRQGLQAALIISELRQIRMSLHK